MPASEVNLLLKTGIHPCLQTAFAAETHLADRVTFEMIADTKNKKSLWLTSEVHVNYHENMSNEVCF
jgi:hypothetical protein